MWLTEKSEFFYVYIFNGVFSYQVLLNVVEKNTILLFWNTEWCVITYVIILF